MTVHEQTRTNEHLDAIRKVFSMWRDDHLIDPDCNEDAVIAHAEALAAERDDLAAQVQRLRSGLGEMVHVYVNSATNSADVRKHTVENILYVNGLVETDSDVPDDEEAITYAGMGYRPEVGRRHYGVDDLLPSPEPEGGCDAHD